MPLPITDKPIYTKTLPASKKIVKFRPFLVKEEKILLMAREENDPFAALEALKQVVNNCTFGAIDVNSLPTIDIEYMLVQLRAVSKGKIIDLVYKCNKQEPDKNGILVPCGKRTTIKFNLDDVTITSQEKDANIIKLSDKIGIVLVYPSYDLSQKIGKIISKENSSLFDIGIEVLYECIESIYDGDSVHTPKDFTKEELTEFFENLTLENKQQIQNFFITLPKLIATIDYECACGKNKEKITVEGLQSFLA